MKNYTFLKIQMLLKTLALIAFLLVGSLELSAQVIKNFTPRTSSAAPAPYTGKQIYTLQGDFKMIGNTNLITQSSSGTTNNSANMKYVDIDGDSNTKNSSSAVLDLGGPNSCLNIVYAGLYWSGRANTGSMTVNVGGKNINKNTIKFKYAGDSYQTITAPTTEILYPNGSYANMYAGYADVTNYVRAHGAGNYFVSDLATSDGMGDGTGWCGGWGLVVVYGNPSLPWRDIIVYDGYAYVINGNASHQLNISGFNAVQQGPVNATLGVMAVEGDNNLTGDYFKIVNPSQATNPNPTSWTALSHAGNSTNNFFNGSIQTGGNTRNPTYTNNMGTDVAKFDLPAGSIVNNQQQTKFLYGSTGDTYVVYSIVLAIDSFIPNAVVVNQIDQVNGAAPAPGYGLGGSPSGIAAGSTLDMSLNVYNIGDEAVNNGLMQVDIPPNMHYVSSSVTSGMFLTSSNTTVTWVAPPGAPSGATPATTPGGTLKWKLNSGVQIPVDANHGTTKLGQLKYQLKVSDNCILLNTSVNSCNNFADITGSLSGSGAVSGSPFTNPAVTNYVTSGTCQPIADSEPFKFDIDASGLDCSAYNIQGGILIIDAGTNPWPRANVTSNYPPGTLFYSAVPDPANPSANLVTGDFPASADHNTRYYAVVPGMPAGCYLILEIKLTICFVPGAGGNGIPTKVGITLLKRAGADNGNWPMNRNGGYLALESKSKGFVVTRVTTTSGITNPQEGMMVYDLTAKCLKIYSDNAWKCFNKPACP